MNAVIYARYSSSSQRDASIDEQIQVCEQYAQKYGYDIIEKYCDRALSGRTSDRPALNQMFKDSAHHRFEVVLVYSVDRLGGSSMICWTVYADCRKTVSPSALRRNLLETLLPDGFPFT